MIFNIYTIFDKVAEEHGDLFQAKSHAVAKRNYENLMAKVDHKQDYDLLYLGTFDTETSEIVLNSSDKLLILGGEDVPS